MNNQRGDGRQQGGGMLEEDRQFLAQLKRRFDELASFDLYAARQLVEDAERLAKLLSGDLKSTQLRKLYSMVKRIESDSKAGKQTAEQTSVNLELLRPRLAYAARRNNGVTALRDVLDVAIMVVNKPLAVAQFEVAFARFVSFFEAVVAYSIEPRK